jgi:hypothetical protein
MTLLFIVRTTIGGHSHMTEVRDCSAEASRTNFRMAEARVFNAEACRFTHIVYRHALASVWV